MRFAKPEFEGLSAALHGDFAGLGTEVVHGTDSHVKVGVCWFRSALLDWLSRLMVVDPHMGGVIHLSEQLDCITWFLPEKHGQVHG